MVEVVFTDTHGSYGWSSATYDVKVVLDDVYDPSTRSASVSVSRIFIRKRDNDLNIPVSPVFGSIQLNGVTVLNLPGGSNYTCHIDGPNYCEVSFPSGASSSIVVPYNSAGEATISVKLVGGVEGQGYNYFCAYYEYYEYADLWVRVFPLYAGVPTVSRSGIELTSHAPAASIRRRENGEWVMYSVYRRENGEWTPYTFKRRESGEWASYC